MAPSSSALTPLVWLEHAGQRLCLLPALGGAVAAWQHQPPAGGALDLWRPWPGDSRDLYQSACFPLVPWSNRIGGGGFEQDGRFHALHPNRAGETFPIHGDGWLQPWRLTASTDSTAVLSLQSRGFRGSPHHYEARQLFRLVPGGLDQNLSVRHLGPAPLPYGLGQHPWFPRTPGAHIQARVRHVWLSGHDRLPLARSGDFAPGWNLNRGIAASLAAIDNAYDGWDGQATLSWPERRLTMTVNARTSEDPDHPGLSCVVYLPDAGDFFCFEPVTHPNNAFNLPRQPGVRVLEPGQELSLHLEWRYCIESD